jgi:hypothetical protein
MATIKTGGLKNARLSEPGIFASKTAPYRSQVTHRRKPNKQGQWASLLFAYRYMHY